MRSRGPRRVGAARFAVACVFCVCCGRVEPPTSAADGGAADARVHVVRPSFDGACDLNGAFAVRTVEFVPSRLKMLAPSLSPDELRIYVEAVDPASRVVGVYSASRATLSEPFSVALPIDGRPPVPVGGGGGLVGDPFISEDELTLYFIGDDGQVTSMSRPTLNSPFAADPHPLPGLTGGNSWPVAYPKVSVPGPRLYYINYGVSDKDGTALQSRTWGGAAWGPEQVVGRVGNVFAISPDGLALFDDRGRWSQRSSLDVPFAAWQGAPELSAAQFYSLSWVSRNLCRVYGSRPVDGKDVISVAERPSL